MKRIMCLALLVSLLSFSVVQSSEPPKTTQPKPSFTGGSKPKPTPVQPKPNFTGGSKPAPSQKPNFTGGGQSSKGVKPTNSIDQKAAKAQERVESKQAMKKAETPASNYTDAKGKVHDIDPKDAKIQQLRNQLDHEKWVNRDNREREFYHNYYSRPVVVYHDPYSSYYWWWLLDQSLEVRAMWAYNHRASMDAARYNDLLARDAQLAARLAQLERDKAKIDPAYTPPGLDSDLQYSDDYVNAVYNPQSSPSNVLGCVCCGFFIISAIGFVVWLFFFKKWNV